MDRTRRQDSDYLVLIRFDTCRPKVLLTDASCTQSIFINYYSPRPRFHSRKHNVGNAEADCERATPAGTSVTFVPRELPWTGCYYGAC